ncbi:MAG: SdiA-regulated domain-containing protein, partial [Bacteriovoracaceae bacterium]|nr:SdiA-regulated domain-containing protein [Bacteriovoracaceae bacterium]
SPSNAGLEGIAIDCENQTLYLAQERSPRAIVVVNLNTLKVEKIGSTKIIKENIHPDYADLFFNNNALYVLERNMRRILKLDPKSLEVIQSVSYASLGPQLQIQDLYNTGEPYGLAEALYMSDRHIFIGLDNNRNSFTKKAKILYPLKGDHSVILKFDRPEGF